MNRNRMIWSVAPTAVLAFVLALSGQQAGTGPGAGNRSAAAAAKTMTETDCTAVKLGASIPASAIGEPVSAVTLNAPQWHPESNGAPAYCTVEGSREPVDRSPTARPIRFGVALPASWASRAAQLGGGGMNGMIPQLTGGVGRGGRCRACCCTWTGADISGSRTSAGTTCW
jgi:feruloyl esterase